MAIIVVGLNQKVAPVEVRECLAFSSDSIKAALIRWRDPIGELDPPPEAVILSTCNRIEVYAVVSDPESAFETVCAFLAKESQQAQENFRPYLYFYTDKEAINHLFSVASGLDSMILGEDQILGQVTEAMEVCLDCGASGKILSALFRNAVETGKRARTETMISQGATSVSHVGVELAQRIFGTLEHCNVLLVGADEMAEMAAQTLIAYGAGSLSIINRTKSNADRLASKFKARSLDWPDLEKTLGWSDIVITATGAPQALFYVDNVQHAMELRKNRPLFFIDISVPRNVDEGVDRLEGVYRYDIDDLESVVEGSLRKRKQEIPKVKKIIREQQEKFNKWFRALDVVPTIVGLRKKADEIRDRELTSVFNQLGDLSQSDKSKIERMSQRIVSQLLHQPTIVLKSKANQCENVDYLEIIHELFGLNGKET